MKKNNTRLKKAVYSMLMLALYQITVFVCNLILPRFILLSYGSEYNGIVSSITQFLHFVSILRLGVAGATRVELYKSLAQEDVKQTSRIIRATEIFMRKVAIVFIIYLIILAIFYPMLVENSYSWYEVASLVMIIGLGTFAQYFWGITYSTLLQADQKLYIYNVIQIFTTISNTIIACILIRFGMSIQIVKFGSAIIFTISPIILNLYVTKHYHLNKKEKPDNTALNNRGDVVAHSIANIVHENTDIVVLTLFSNVKLVSVYTVYNLIMNGLKQLMNIFTSGLESAFGDMWVKNETKKMKNNFELFEYIIAVFVSLVFSSAFVLIIPFVKIYTNGITDIEYVLPIYAALALLAQAFYCIRMPYLTLVQAAGKYKETKNGAFIEALLNIVISVCLVIKIGIYGVIIGTLVANIFRTIQYSVFVDKNLLYRSHIILIKKILWIILNICITILMYSLCIAKLNMIIVEWKNWVVCGLFVFIIAIIIVLLTSLIFYRQSLIQLIQLLIKLLNIKINDCKKQ